MREAGYLPFARGADGLLRLGQRPGGRCVYLRQDMLCAVHREAGPAAKPAVCRMFPFLPVRTPDGLFVGLSFRCTAVQVGHGGPASRHAAEVAALAEEVGCPEVGSRVTLAPGRELTWEGYLRAEGVVGEALAGGGTWPAAARLALAAAGPAGPPWDAAALEARLPPEPPRTPATAAMEQLAAASLVAWLETDQPGEMAAITRGLPAGEAFPSRRLGRVVEPARLPRPGPWIDAPVRRYLEALVFRKFLALGPSLVARLWALHAVGPVVRFYAGLSAREAGRPEPGREDLHRAWDVVEGELVSHVEGLDPLFESLADGFAAALGIHRT